MRSGILIKINLFGKKMGCGASNEQPTTVPRDSKGNKNNSKQPLKAAAGSSQNSQKNQGQLKQSTSKVTTSRSVPKKAESNLRTSRTNTGNSDE